MTQATRRTAVAPRRAATVRRERPTAAKKSASKKRRAQSKPQETCIYKEASTPPNPLPLCNTISVTTLHVIRADMDLIGLPEGEKRFIMSFLKKREELQHLYFKRLQLVKQYINEYDHCQKYREMLQQYIEITSRSSPSAMAESDVERLIGALTRYSYYTVRIITLICHLRLDLDAPVGLPQLKPVHSIYHSTWYNIVRKNTLYTAGMAEKIFVLTRFCGTNGTLLDAERQISEYTRSRAAASLERPSNKFGSHQDPTLDFPLRLLLNAPFSTLNEQQGCTSIVSSAVQPPRANAPVELNTRPIPDLITKWNAFLWSHPSAYQPRERTNSLQLRALTGAECLAFISDEEHTLTGYSYERRMDKTFANKNILLRTVIIPVDPSAEYRETYLVDGSSSL